MHEQEVLALLRAGDERGAEALLRHYAPLMRYIIAPIVPDAQDREECLSDAALRVWEKFGTYDPARDRGRHGSRRSRATPRSTARGKSPAAARSFRATCPPPSRRPRSGSCSRSADRRSSAR